MIKSYSYYIPLNSNSLAHYFSRGVILPSKYYTNKIDDIQNVLKESILLSNKRWVGNVDCSLEIVLTEVENGSLVRLSENFLRNNAPIPISRVKRIHFLNKEQSRTTVWNINNGTAFIPEALVHVDYSDGNHFNSEAELDHLYVSEESVDISKKVKFYDHLLGGLAFMRIGGEAYMNYSENYFPTLSYFNSLIRNEYKKLESENKVTFSDKYYGVFTKNEGYWGKWQSYFYQNIEAEDVENLASEEGVTLNKKLGILQLDSINKKSIIYDLALLATYGDKKNKSIDNFVSDISNGSIPNEKREEGTLLMGLNNGYSRLRNRYKLSGVDKVVKFELSSRLDYYTIESIYQFAFNGVKENYKFPYIDEWIPQADEKIPPKGTYKILDKIVIAKKKIQPFSQEYLGDFLQNNFHREIYSNIVKQISLWLPPFTQIKEDDGIKHFEALLSKPVTTWSKNIIYKLKLDYETNLTEQKEELLQHFEEERTLLNNTIKTLSLEINLLKAQLLNIKTSSKTVTSETKPKEIIMPNIENEQTHSMGRGNSQVHSDYYSMSVKELKQVAKDKRIKPIPDKRDDIIKAINSIQTFL